MRRRKSLLERQNELLEASGFSKPKKKVLAAKSPSETSSKQRSAPRRKSLLERQNELLEKSGFSKSKKVSSADGVSKKTRSVRRSLVEKTTELLSDAGEGTWGEWM